MTRPRAGGADGEREGEGEDKRCKREGERKFQIVVWREDFGGGGGTFGLASVSGLGLVSWAAKAKGAWPN